MPNIITPRHLALIFLASTTQTTGGFVIQIPEVLLAEDKHSKIINYKIFPFKLIKGSENPLCSEMALKLSRMQIN